MDDDVVAQQANLRTAAHDTFQHVAAGDGADLRDPIDLAHLDEAEPVLLLLRRQHARQRGLHLVDRFVDDVVVADLHAARFGELARLRVGARVEADDDRLRREREVDVRLGDAAHRRMHDVDLHLVGRQLGQRLRQRLVAALHVGLDDQRQRLDAGLAHLVEHVLELRRLLLRELHVAELALAEQRDFARLALVAERDHFFARQRNVRQALDLDRESQDPLRSPACRFRRSSRARGRTPHPPARCRRASACPNARAPSRPARGPCRAATR